MSSQGHDDDVHVYEGSGIEEGNAPVPRWYFLVAAILVTFYIVYLCRYMFGAQPSAAKLRSALPTSVAVRPL